MNLDKELANAKKGVYTFRIHGMVHHSIGQLLLREGQPRAFVQIYIHDGTPAGVSGREVPPGALRASGYDAYLQSIRLLLQIGDICDSSAWCCRHWMTIRAEGLSDPRRNNAPTAQDIDVIMSENS